MTHAKSDVLVIGSGLAGLVFALEAASRGTVTVLAKAAASQTNTAFAQGGIAAVLASSDSFESHISDSLEDVCGLNNPEDVALLVRQAPEAIEYLQHLGVPFCRKQRQPDLHLEGGHTHARIAHVRDYTGLSLQNTLLAAARAHPNITLLEHRFALDLRVVETANGERACAGVHCLNTQTNQPETYAASATLLATGGLGQVYSRTTNPAIATADGLAMAARAGAQVADLEFVQFHPTALYSPGHEPVFLISEAVRGAGAVLRNAAGEEFMLKRHVLGSLAPRDVVARAIAEEMAASGQDFVCLDVSGIAAPEMRSMFPTIYHTCLNRGIDCTKQAIPVSPAAHYACGGVATDVHGQTSLPRLFAAGEVACTGVHGANRLASNSLLEAVVFGLRAARKAALLQPMQAPFLPAQTGPKPAMPHFFSPKEPRLLKAELQRRMWQHAGLVRRPAQLQRLQAWLRALTQKLEVEYLAALPVAWLELRNLAQAALLITNAALSRRHSVGGHFLAQPRPRKWHTRKPRRPVLPPN